MPRPAATRRPGSAAVARRHLGRYVGLLLAACVLLACENDPAAVAALFPDTRLDAEVITDFETIYSDSAEVRVRIRGPRLLRFQEDDGYMQVFPDGAEIDFFDDAGEVSSTLTCGYGVRYETEERVTLRDSVVWRSRAGDRLDTEELLWDARAEQISSDRLVRLRQSDKEITGVGFEADQDFSRAKVLAIQGIVSLRERPRATPVDSTRAGD